MTAKPIYILEGPDGAGKSTLAAKLATALGGAIIAHHGPYLNLGGHALAQTYLDSMLPALMGEQAVILDRSWISEQVYGEVYRKGSRLTVEMQNTIEAAAADAGVAVIVCLPPLPAVLQVWEARKGQEYLTHQKAVTDVWHRYAGRAYTTRFFPTIYDYTQRQPLTTISTRIFDL